jgi:hypothetical protein
MVFWTIVFLTYALACLVNGNLFYNIMKKNGLLLIQQAEVTTKEEKEKIGKEILKNALPMFFTLPIVFGMFIYFICALSVDILKYPTIITLFYALIVTIVSNKNKTPKVDLTTEEGRIRAKINIEKMKRYSFKGVITQLIYVTYFSYMFYLLVIR